MGTLEYRSITVAEIADFAREMDERNPVEGDLCPIPVHIAEAQALNPLAEPDDLARVVVFDGDRCVGYCGAVPGRAVANGESFKVSFPSMFYIHPEYRSLGPALAVMRRIYEQPCDVVGATMSDLNSVVLKRIGVHGHLGPRRDATLDPGRMRAAMARVLGRLPRLGGLRRVAEAAADRIAYPTMRWCFWWVLSTCSVWSRRGLRFEEIDSVEPDVFAPPHDTKWRMYRGGDVVNWQLRHPWLLSEDETTARYPNHHFASVIPHYRLCAVSVRNRRGEEQGVAVLSVQTRGRTTMLKVLDRTRGKPEFDRSLASLVAAYSRRNGVDVVVFDEDLLGLICRRAMTKPFAGGRLHEYAVRVASDDSPLAADDDVEVELSICDCDMPFV